MDRLLDKLGYQFTQPALLEQALRHPSLSRQEDNRLGSNQRLEFLGDSVLGLLVAELLYHLYPNEEEGALARRFSALVCSESLVGIAREWHIDEALVLGAGEEEAGGRNTPSNLEDACEAVIGAIYLDGGLEAVRPIIDRYWTPLAKANLEPPKDPKTQLQEWAQGRGLPLPEYHMLSSMGPAHAPIFTVSAVVEGLPPTTATAASKKQAQQEAAAMMLEQIK